LADAGERRRPGLAGLDRPKPVLDALTPRVSWIERIGRCHLGTREARADVVWAVMSDGEGWPEWTASVTSVRRLDKGPLRIGSRALIRQPRFPPAVWTVTTLEPGHRFVWKSGMPGMWVYGDHSVAPATHGTRATLRLFYDGLVMGRMTRGITNRYLDMEAAGLKRRSEENARAALSAS
jgi:uncharacterized membrane protein